MGYISHNHNVITAPRRWRKHGLFGGQDEPVSVGLTSTAVGMSAVRVYERIDRLRFGIREARIRPVWMMPAVLRNRREASLLIAMIISMTASSGSTPGITSRV